ncbi:MAG TPA: lysine--tRNA ligase, partial [Candidatus Limnocylindrales bacterium]
VGTTIVSKWDGERVYYECRADLVTWAHGCGTTGWISPFGGAAKLPWNLEWAAQWSLFGVTIEPGGKDLSTAGGSRDRSDAIAREVFEREPPLNVPYEFLNIGGRKMSTSKGRGAAAHSIAEVIPPEQLRFLFLRPRPNQAIEFDPEGTDAIPRLFDEFDRFAAATAGREVKGELTPGFEATFRYALLDPEADVAAEASAFRPAFAHLALLLQIPGVDVVARVEAEKGSPLSVHEREILDRRVAAARAWLDGYAPDAARLTVRHDALPDAAGGLDAEQRRFLASLSTTARPGSPAGGDAWQTLIFAAAAAQELPARRAFEAIYLAFLGRPNGPRAGWLLASLDASFVLGRLDEAAGAAIAGAAERGAS